MVATQTAAGVAGGIVVYRFARGFDVHSDPCFDGAIKGAASIAAMLASIKADGVMKTALISVGVGLGAAAAGEYVPFL